MATMTTTDLQTLKDQAAEALRLAEAATPEVDANLVEPIVDGERCWMISTPTKGERIRLLKERKTVTANAKLYAASRTLLPTLAAGIERLAAEVEELRTRVEIAEGMMRAGARLVEREEPPCRDE